MRQPALLITVVVFALSAAVSANTPDEKSPPDWLIQAAKATNPTYQKDVPAVVLHNEQTVAVGTNGTLTITSYYAVRLLTREGKGYANAGVGYLQSASKVRDLRAWLIRPNGQTKFYGKAETLDQISDPDDIYDEYRVKTIDGSDDADVGMVFGFATVLEDKPLFTQDRFGFQRRLPTLFSRYTLSLPAGWQATSLTFNHPEIKPTVNGTTHSWELRNLDPIPPEPDSLSVANLAPRIVVNYYPPTANAHVYDSWRDVSRWYTELSSESLTLDDNIAGKARELTANAKTELERIRAIGEYAQSIRYISLQLDVARGGGHRPRPANLILQRGYGDCKDKANLMRAMLKALKIDSYLVLIYSGDPAYVRAEWASPRQFNHCIIAVKVSPETDAPSIMTHEKLGRLLIFDATDPYTQVGDIPDHEQGSFALVAAGADGDLLKMPTLPPDANKLEREADVTVDADGAIVGKIIQRANGQAAAYERSRIRELSAADYKTGLDRWLSNRVAGGSLTKATPQDHKAASRFDLELEFRAPVYAQIMQNRLMMFKPAMVGRLDQFTPVEGKRITPIVIDASSYSETIRIKLPVGFEIDEIPDGGKIEAAFGTYSHKYDVAGDLLTFTRSLVLKRTIVPPAGYDDVGRFFAAVRGSEASPVVLIRK